ncbi:MAG: Rieske (2Fe-2S) protein, partial [Candidatus Poseidoniaceae archaeon]
MTGRGYRCRRVDPTCSFHASADRVWRGRSSLLRAPREGPNALAVLLGGIQAVAVAGVEVEGHDIALVRCDEGVFAIGNRCSHADVDLS